MSNERKLEGHHDLGGHPAGPIVREEHDPAFWEKRVDALVILLSAKYGMLRVDEMRRAIEQLSADAYRTLSYYERWIAALAFHLVDKGILAQADIDARIDRIRARQPAPEAKQ